MFLDFFWSQELVTVSAHHGSGLEADFVVVDLSPLQGFSVLLVLLTHHLIFRAGDAIFALHIQLLKIALVFCQSPRNFFRLFLV